MSLMGTLAKVAIGIAVAKGVSSMIGKKAGSGSAGADGSYGGPHSPGRAGGGLEDMMGEILGGKKAPANPSGGMFGGTAGNGGGLGGYLEELGRYAPGNAGAAGTATSSRGGSLDDLIGSLGGGAGGGGAGSGGMGQGGAGGSLGDLLGGLLGGAQGTTGPGGGGLGDLLGGLIGGMAGGSATGGSATGRGGSFGDLLNQSLGNRGEPDAAPTPAQNAVAGLMLSAMIQAAKADGKVDAEEQRKLLGNLGDVTAEEKRFVEAQLRAPIDVPRLAQQVPQGLEAQVYAMSLMAISLDNRNEATYLHQLATAMRLDPRQVNQIHAQLGAPAIYG